MTALLWVCIVALAVAALATLAKAAEMLASLKRVVARMSALQERADSALEGGVLPLLEATDSLRAAGDRLRAQTLGLAARLLPGEDAPRPLSAKVQMAAEFARTFLRLATGGSGRGGM
ncbi:MAG: hypothetical protein KatS3mg015_0123 [Fimbriimonadales bacterium]|nr:MAG: hypothetical protein KatS3mg015_0123 [Fimbriimonadales bacterium]